MDIAKLRDVVVELIAAWGLRVVGVLVALFVGWLAAGWARRLLTRGLERANFDTTLTIFFGNMLRYAILIAVALGCLGVFGIQTTSFAALIAAGGLAIGLAFQGTLSNFAAGIMLLVFRPFRVGDVVSVADVVGVVQEIELFTTELTALDNRRIIVPNSSIFGSKIENLTHHDTRRVDVPVGTAYAADIDQTREVLERLLAEVPGVLEEPAPQVFLAGLGSSSIDWKLRAWCKTEDYWDVWQGVVRAAKRGLDDAKIGIPFPQTDVHLDAEALQAFKR